MPGLSEGEFVTSMLPELPCNSIRPISLADEQRRSDRPPHPPTEGAPQGRGPRKVKKIIRWTRCNKACDIDAIT